MKVNIVVRGADLPWIAGRLAHELVERLPHYGVDAYVNGRPGDLEYQQIVYGPPSRLPAVGLFTHGEGRAAANAPHYTGHIALNPRIAQVLRDAGAPNPVVIEQAVDPIFLKEGAPLFGVAGSTKADGRKGEALVQQMLDAGYRVAAWGTGWPSGCTSFGTKFADLVEIYRAIDYYVVTSNDEGGCTPIIECMAMHVPVITPRIGFAINRPVLDYEAGSWPSLHTVLRYLTEHSTYDDWARLHAQYFQQVLG